MFHRCPPPPLTTDFDVQSSLTLALLRCILTEGKVYYDGIATDSVNLDALRSHVTIIPQVVGYFPRFLCSVS